MTSVRRDIRLATESPLSKVQIARKKLINSSSHYAIDYMLHHKCFTLNNVMSEAESSQQLNYIRHKLLLTRKKYHG